MSLQQLCSRLSRLEVQRRPWVVADVLQRVRQCAPSELGALLMVELTTVDRTTAFAIMEQLTDAELEALIPPEMYAFIETLTARELETLANGDPLALQQVWRSYQYWRHDRV